MSNKNYVVKPYGHLHVVALVKDVEKGNNRNIEGFSHYYKGDLTLLGVACL